MLEPNLPYTEVVAFKLWKWVLTPILFLYISAWAVLAVLHQTGYIKELPSNSGTSPVAACIFIVNMQFLRRANQKFQKGPRNINSNGHVI